MSACFSHLRIAGFKSFADPIGIDILPGLTGIVGPNGCGKSNVVEALRWAMGEVSARSLRGGELDDLIFAGTTSRAARSTAEVTITLQSAQGLGPGAFAEQDELQISRSAERGAGSDYRINGRAVRGRDVQTLFADLASGARSSAMVSQGKVAALVGARPEERRIILEEAAGITGLHARRHEAEIRLRATEGNLSRASDLCGQLEERLEGLTEQSGHAARYRELSTSLRDSENALLALLHARARLAVQQTIDAAAAARRDMVAAEERTEGAVLADYETAKVLPELRAAADEARTALERHRIMSENMVREEERASAALQAAELRLEQSRNDHESASARVHDARAALTRLEEEQGAATEELASLPQRLADATQALEELSAALKTVNTELERRNEAVSAARLAVSQAEAVREAAVVAHKRLSSTFIEIENEIASLKNDLPAAETIADIEAHVRQLTADLVTAREQVEVTAQLHSEARLALSVASNEAETVSRRWRELQDAEETARKRLEMLRRDHATTKQHCQQAEQGLIAENELQSLEVARLAAEKEHEAAVAAVAAAEEAKIASTAALMELRGQLREENSLRAARISAQKATKEALSHAAETEKKLGIDLSEAEKNAVPEENLTRIRSVRKDLEQRLEEAGKTQDEVTRAAAAASEAEQYALQERDRQAADIARLTARIEGLAQAVGASEGQKAPPVSDALSIPEGLELPLAVALGEGLAAAEEAVDLFSQSSRLWRQMNVAVPSLPSGVVSLASLIGHPESLAAALSAVGLIDGDGEKLQKLLKPGQCLVSRDGGLWRWDGYSVRPGQPDATAVRLAQQRALKLAETELLDLRSLLEKAEAELLKFRSAAAQAKEAVAVAVRARAEIETALTQARAEEAEISGLYAATLARLEALRPQYERARQALAVATQAHADAERILREMPEAAVLSEQAGKARVIDEEAAVIFSEARERRSRAAQIFEKARNEAQAASSRHEAAEGRLAGLRPHLERLTSELSGAEEAWKMAQEAVSAADRPEAIRQKNADAEIEAGRTGKQAEAARAEVARLVPALEAATTACNEMQARIAGLNTRLAILATRREAVEKEVAAAWLEVEKAEAGVSTCAGPDEEMNHIIRLRAEMEQMLARAEALREQRAGLAAGEEGLKQKLLAQKTGQAEWKIRQQSAEEELSGATARLAVAEEEHSKLSAIPVAVRAQREAGSDALTAAEKLTDDAMAALLEAEKRQQAAREARQTGEAALVVAREEVLRAEGRRDQAQAILAQLLAENAEPPMVQVADLTENAETALRRKIARLVREREALGPVNLRADVEATEIGGRIETIHRERSELETAIARLRGSIGALNREGRERLLAVFNEVNQHFQSLFSRMFGGGRAHLGLVGSDDVLQAGLEIYAQPPGKKLATLSLLSGGEQALTALSLIFAVFRCNPAPVCVLDEVDAPLDEANVGRFCALLSDMVKEAGTRFLVVTHHQLTMAHMDRLYGVTMQERGVSRVLSVDLERASAMAGHAHSGNIRTEIADAIA